MCIARGETQPLPGSDENAYVAYASFDQWPTAHILDDFVAVHLGTILRSDSLSYVEQLLSGVAYNNPFKVRSLMWIIAGHTRHHLWILE